MSRAGEFRTAAVVRAIRAVAPPGMGDFAARKIAAAAIEAVTAANKSDNPRQPAPFVPGEGVDREDLQFNRGVQHVVDLLSTTIGADGWVSGDGSEDYDDDLRQTLLNILAARGLYDPETDALAALPGARS